MFANTVSAVSGLWSADRTALEHYAHAAEHWDFEGWRQQRAAEKDPAAQHDLVVLHDDKDFPTDNLT